MARKKDDMPKGLNSEEQIAYFKNKFGSKWYLHLNQREEEGKKKPKKRSKKKVEGEKSKEKNKKKKEEKPFGIRKNSIEKVIIFRGERFVALIKKASPPPLLATFSIEGVIQKKMISCPLYVICNNAAAEANFSFFSCEECQKYNPEKQV